MGLWKGHRKESLVVLGTGGITCNPLSWIFWVATFTTGKGDYISTGTTISSIVPVLRFLVVAALCGFLGPDSSRSRRRKKDQESSGQQHIIGMELP